MITNIKFYKSAAGKLILNDSRINACTIHITYNADETIVMRWVDDNSKIFIKSKTYNDFIKENGDPYISLVEFQAAAEAFFVTTASSETQDAMLAALKGNKGNFGVLITRPENQNQYAAFDVVGDVTGTLRKIVNVAKAVGKPVTIKRVRIQTNDTGVAGTVFNVVFHNADIAVIADNNPYTIVDADYLKRGGMIPVVMGIAPFGKVGDNDTKYITITPTDRDIRVKLITESWFIPSANGTWFYIGIDVELDN